MTATDESELLNDVNGPIEFSSSNHCNSQHSAADNNSDVYNYASEFENSECNSVTSCQQNISNSKLESRSGIIAPEIRYGTLQNPTPHKRCELRNLKSMNRGKRMQPAKSGTNMVSVMERWENTRIALADSQSQNTLLRRQLEECRSELKTVQRQYKLQSIRLNRVIGQEADFPQIIDRLSAEIRSLQIRVREKTSQCESTQRKLQDLQRRLGIYEKEFAEKRGDELSNLKKMPNATADQLAQQLERERHKVAVLQRQLDLATRTHRHRLTTANEQIRKLRKSCHDLEETLAERTRMLQEKIKLLELQNIYSQRIPRRLPVQIPPSDATSVLGVTCRSSVGTDRFLVQEAAAAAPPPPPFMSKPEKSQPITMTTGPNCATTCEPISTDKSETLHSLDQMAYEVAEGRIIESLVDPTTTLDGKSSSTKEVIEIGETCAKHPPHCENKHGDKSCGETCTSCDIPRVNSEEVDTLRSQEDFLSVQSSGRPISREPPRFCTRIEIVNVNDSLNNQQIDPAEDSSTCKPSGDKLEVEEAIETGHTPDDPDQRERERKDRLLRTLCSLDISEAETTSSPLTAVAVEDTLEKSKPMHAIETENMDDLTSFRKSREKELWNDLFGSETKTQSADRKEATIATTTERRRAPTKLTFGDYVPTMHTKPTNVTNRERHQNRSQTVPSLPQLSKSKERHANGVHPKYNKSHYFQRNDDDEADSDVEEFHV